MPGRYDDSEIATIEVTDTDGAVLPVRYLRRRFPPQNPGMTLALHRVRSDDRLDLISQNYLGDPTAFWMVCDANAALDPEDLTGPDAEDSVMIIPVPGR